METKQVESLKAQVSRYKRILKDKLGEGIWGLKKEGDRFTHEEIIFLFARIFPALGFDCVKELRTEYPDCICYRDGKEVGIEFEPVLSSFRDHIGKNDLSRCQFIVCWKDDTSIHNSIYEEIKDRNIQIIELKTFFEDVKVSDRSHPKAIMQKDVDRFSMNKLRVVKAFITYGKDILTREEISEAIGIRGRGLGGALKGFTEMERSRTDWIVRQRPDKKWELNSKHKSKVISALKKWGSP